MEEKIFAITDPGVIAISCGVSEMVDENMANAVRVHAVENGRDVENFTMIGFGGGAPLQACRLCEKLRLNNLLIPPGAGVGSVITFLPAPFSYEVTRSYFQQLGELIEYYLKLFDFVRILLQLNLLHQMVLFLEDM